MTLNAFVLEDLPALLDLIYGAAVNKELWPLFLDRLRKPFDGANGILHFFDIETQTTPLAFPFGLEQKYLVGYQEHFSSCNPYPVQSFARLAPFTVTPATAVVSREEALRSEFYNDWMRPQGISPEHLGCMIHNDGREMVVLAIAPDEKKLERDGDRYTRQFELLTPHLKRAVALSKVNRADPMSAGLPAQFSCIAILISQNRAVKAVNPPAESHLRERSFLSIDPIGKLRIKDSDVHSAFLTAVDAVFNCQAPVGGPVQCRLPVSGDRASLVVLKLPMLEAPHALVLLISERNERADQFPSQFTSAEARLAKALLTGLSLADFSDQAGISINTARKQLAALFAKTGTNRQAALVAWLLQRN
ncbi:MAG: helix-turn-helix transcriptional regulator [Hyphomicrobium sp.]|uniref:helix-turn-helix transcriptional regulator n=1 Tax=Hyphomicrobium sp. TaxID=82 RepID=UPI0039E30799